MRQIDHRVAHEHLVIEIDHIETDDEIRALQLPDEFMHALLAVNRVFSGARAVSRSNRHSHGGFFVPSARVIRRALRFQIEINNIHRVDSLFYPPRPKHTRYR